MREENWAGLIVAVALVGHLTAAVMRPGRL
ncbi:potassium-transporting ATPase subunit F [Streptomyces wuyuanensis]